MSRDEGGRPCLRTKEGGPRFGPPAQRGETGSQFQVGISNPRSQAAPKLYSSALPISRPGAAP
jgi:hypothetical protein